MLYHDVLRFLDPTAKTLLIDGRSGSGKSTLAAQICTVWKKSLILKMDDIYPGWKGLAWATKHLQKSILEPRSIGYNGLCRQWCWETYKPSYWQVIAPQQRLIIEGTGTLTLATKLISDLNIWVEVDDLERKRRVANRDIYFNSLYWKIWAEQEVKFINQFQPKQCADLIAKNNKNKFEIQMLY